MANEMQEPRTGAPASGETYEICVRGSLNPDWSEWLGGLEIHWLPGGETRLTGFVPDQAALQGILSKLYAMNLPLLSVRRIEGDHISGESI